jgi:hypothetical protein
LTPEYFCAQTVKVCPQIYEVISLEDDVKKILSEMPDDAPGFIDSMYEYFSQDKEPRETIKFIHFSDAHLDMKYEVGATADCGQEYCCRSQSETGQGHVKAGYWGPNPNSSNTCDVPLHTI